jgi:vacuolar protein sorting-associated protein 54
MTQTTQQQRFSSNLCAVLNDPRKDRAQVNHLFTKTWGSDFVDSSVVVVVAAAANSDSSSSSSSRLKKNDFKDYLIELSQRSSKHCKNKLDLLNTSSSLTTSKSHLHINDLDQIPKIFLDVNFCLTNGETFNALISSSYNATATATATAASHNCQRVLDSLSSNLDTIELHISKQISHKATRFFNAIHSQDQVQEHVQATLRLLRHVRSSLASNSSSRLLLRVLQLVTRRTRLTRIVRKLELMSHVHLTQPHIQLHLGSLEFEYGLDLIVTSQDILRRDLSGIRSLRHYDSQLSEIERVIDKMLHQEFVKCLRSVTTSK